MQMDDRINTPAIETQSLRKVFGDKTAVNDLTLRVERGEVFGFLGPNGAGKTTSVKMLLGLIYPTSGSARILGYPLGDPRGRAHAGFLPEHFRFHDWLSAAEFLGLHAELYHLPADVARKRIPELLELVGLSPFRNQKLRTFSKGMLQRVGLAQALLNEPQVVFLDEPTSGLDPVGRLHVRDIIRSLRERGATVFLNSHLLSEVEITCDRVAFVKHGSVVQVSPLKGLVDGEVELALKIHPVNAEILKGLERWSPTIKVKDELILMSLLNSEAVPEINRYLVGLGAEVFSLHPQKLSLEDLFIRIIGTDGGL
jgi:ABC-2 type transport system ATP-binding protein